jgi:hypothetical protein
MVTVAVISGWRRGGPMSVDISADPVYILLNIYYQELNHG